MTPSRVRKFLKEIGAENIQQSGKWVQTNCPLAPWTHDSGHDSHPSFAISCTPGKESVFNCFTCKSGDLLYLIQLLKQYGAGRPKYNIKRALDILAEEDEDEFSLSINDFDERQQQANMIVPWDERWLDSFMQATNVPMALQYLSSRHVSASMAEYLDIRWDGSKDCVAFPVRDWNGRLCGLRGRRVKGGYYDYGGPNNRRNRLVWYGEQHLDTTKPVVMVESVFDYASVARVYKNLCGPMTVGMSPEKVGRMAACLDIVTLFDNGVGGDKARGKIDKYLSSAIIQHCYPPENLSDPGDMTVEELVFTLGGKVKLQVALSG